MLSYVPQSLTGKTLVWYARLPPRSITCLKNLGEKFIQNFLPQFIFQLASNFLSSVWHQRSKSVRDFTALFNQAAQENSSSFLQGIHSDLQAWLNKPFSFSKISTERTIQYQCSFGQNSKVYTCERLCTKETRIK